MSTALTISLIGEWDLARKGELTLLLQPAQESFEVVIDFLETQYIDSTVLSSLAAMRNRREASALSPAHFVVGPGNIRRLFEVVNFDKFFPMFETVEAAIRAFNSPPDREDAASLRASN